LASNFNPRPEKAEEHVQQGIKMLEERGAKAFLPQGYFFLGELNANTGKKKERGSFIPMQLPHLQKL
jgi:hypothetical protein